MSVWRRFWRSLGFSRSTSSIRIEGGGTIQIGDITYTIVDGELMKTTYKSGTTDKIDLGPEIERKFEAPAPASDAVSLSKESPATGLRLRNFDATISVVATSEVTTPQVTITGREKLLEGITARMNGAFFELTAPKQQLAVSFMMIVKMLTARVTTWKLQPVCVTAKVPLHAPLSFKDTSGIISTTGVFGALDGSFDYSTEAAFSSFTDVTVSTESSCTLTVSKMAGSLNANLGYNNQLEIEAGSVGDCVIDTDSSCIVTLYASVNSLRADLEYNSTLSVNGTTNNARVKTDSSCAVDFTELRGTFSADLGYNCTLMAQSGDLTSVNLKADSSCTVKLSAVRVNVLDADLGYNCTLKVNAQLKKSTVNADSSCTVGVTSVLGWLKANLEYNCTLKIGDTINKLLLDADSSCTITVKGAINTGSLRAGFNTTVSATRVGDEVDRRQMSKSSELVITG